jgi:hypothetical protein
VALVSSKYFSRRALGVHVALLAWLAMCVVAAYWQIGRAFGGNSLSFLYAIEWPCFAVLGFYGWWALLHVEKPTADQERERRAYEERMRAEAALARSLEAKEVDDPTLAAYNDHLANLSTVPKKKLWGH